MDKAILIMDDPKFCCNCSLVKSRRHNITKEEIWICGIAQKDKYDYYWNSVDIDSETKPNWCPLQKLPDEVKPGSNNIVVEAYCDGWNDFRDNILNTQEV